MDNINFSILLAHSTSVTNIAKGTAENLSALPAYIHVLFNHIPIIGLFVILIFYVFSITYKSEIFERISLWGFLAVGLATVIVYFSGHGAEELAETIYSKEYVETHELFGNIASFCMFGLGILALLNNLFYRSVSGKIFFRVAIIVISIVGLILSGLAGMTGGKIAHSEFRW